MICLEYLSAYILPSLSLLINKFSILDSIGIGPGRNSLWERAVDHLLQLFKVRLEHGPGN